MKYIISVLLASSLFAFSEAIIGGVIGGVVSPPYSVGVPAICYNGVGFGCPNTPTIPTPSPPTYSPRPRPRPRPSPRPAPRPKTPPPPRPYPPYIPSPLQNPCQRWGIGCPTTTIRPYTRRPTRRPNRPSTVSKNTYSYMARSTLNVHIVKS